jgi:hypothetical protein
MKEDLIADLWSIVVEHIPEKERKNVASDYINTLIDYGVKESTIQGLLGIDPYLDDAIEYVVDGEEIEEEEEDYYDEDE